MCLPSGLPRCSWVIRILRRQNLSVRASERQFSPAQLLGGRRTGRWSEGDFATAIAILNATALSGKAMARTGLRMMPTFPLPPLKFRTAGFPRYGFKAGISDAAFPAYWFAIVLRALCCHRNSLLCVRDDALVSTSVRADLPPYPRGPRSGPGYSVPVHHHLIGPIRPTRGHIPTSPSHGLYEMPSLCIFAYA
jgi:hypothetical protein